MNCPYCGKEMTETLLQGGGGPIRWSRTTTKTLGLLDMGSGDRFLAVSHDLVGYYTPCATCLDCGKIIVDLPAATAP